MYDHNEFMILLFFVTVLLPHYQGCNLPIRYEKVFHHLFFTVYSLYLRVPRSFKLWLTSLRTVIPFFSDRKNVMVFHGSYREILSKFQNQPSLHILVAGMFSTTLIAFNFFDQLINRWQQIALLPLISSPEGYTHLF